MASSKRSTADRYCSSSSSTTASEFRMIVRIARSPARSRWAAASCQSARFCGDVCATTPRAPRARPASLLPPALRAISMASSAYRAPRHGLRETPPPRPGPAPPLMSRRGQANRERVRSPAASVPPRRAARPRIPIQACSPAHHRSGTGPWPGPRLGPGQDRAKAARTTSMP